MDDSIMTFRFKEDGIDAIRAKADALGVTLTSLTQNTNGTFSASGKLSSALDKQAASTDKTANTTNKAAAAHENYFVHIAKTTVQSALVNKAFLGLVDSMGQAVQQVDLMTNFPAAMGALGLSTKDASQSLDVLRQYAQQAGISLTDAVQTVTRFAEVTKDVKAASVEFIGVKNALIAGAAPAEQQKNAMEQLTQAYSRGRPQLTEWRSLMTAMPAQLTAVAIAMHQPNAQALGEQLTKGKISMQDFMTELTKLSTNGGSIAKSTAVHMQGIAYASNVMQATLTNGLAAIYTAIGRQNIIGFFSFMTQVISAASQGIVFFIDTMIKLYNVIAGLFGGSPVKSLTKDLGDSTAAGASNASDMADGLGSAADNAAKINKSLASFDKMNVLPDKTSKDTTDTGQNGLDPSTAAALDKMFGDLAFNLKEASVWAKIFAGILGALAGNALIAKLFGVNPLKELIKDLGKAASQATGFTDALKNNGGNAFKAGQELGNKTREGMATGLSKIGETLSGAAGGLASVVTTTVAPAVGGAFISAFSGIGIAIAGVFGVELAAGIGAALIGFGIVILAIAAIIAIIWLIWTNWQTIWGWIKTAFDVVWGAIVATWNTLFEIFKAPVMFIWQFITAIFILIVAIIATALQLIFDIVAGIVIGIYTVLAAIAGWINTNVIQPVWQFFQWLWDTITNAVVAAWQWIYANVLKPIGTWVYNNVILPVVGFFKGMWDTVSGFFSGIFGSFVNFLSPIGSWLYNNVILPVGRFFQGMWDGVLQGLKNMWTSLTNIFGSLGGVIKAPINGVIDLINTVLTQLNKVKVPDWVPGLGGKAVNFPMIPKLAQGGVVSQPTMALIGESGSEAVMPLENNTGWIDTLASKLNDKAGNQPVQLVVQIGEEKIVTKLIDLINEKTNMSGRNVIYV